MNFFGNRLCTLAICLCLVPNAHAQTTPGKQQIQPSTQGVPKITMAEARAKLPALAELDDNDFVDAVRELYYPDVPRATLAAELNVLPRPTRPPRKKLGIFEQWRFDSCQESATKAPTQHGVNVGINLCRERFGQTP
jgi:hypothetical protein